MSIWSVTSAPAAEPLARAYVKNWLKVPASVTTDDDLVDDLIKEAREFVERMTGRALITQTITEYWDEWPNERSNSRIIYPTVAPLQSVTSISYVADGGTPAAYTTWASTNYTVDAVSGGKFPGPARVYRNPDVDWPDLEDDYLNRIKMEYVVGYGASGASVPGPLKMAMLRLIGIWYYGRDNRNMNDYEVVAALLNPYKVHK